MPDSKANNQENWKMLVQNWDGQEEDMGWDKTAAWASLQSRLEPSSKKSRPGFILWPAIAAAIFLTIFLLPKKDEPANSPIIQVVAPGTKTGPSAAAENTQKIMPDRAIITNEPVAELVRKVIPSVKKKTVEKIAPALAAIVISPVLGKLSDSTSNTQVEKLLQTGLQTPLTPKKQKVFHLNEINTPQELLTVEAAKDQRRQFLYSRKTEPENKAVNQRPSTWIISLNN